MRFHRKNKLLLLFFFLHELFFFIERSLKPEYLGIQWLLKIHFSWKSYTLNKELKVLGVSPLNRAVVDHCVSAVSQEDILFILILSVDRFNNKPQLSTIPVAKQNAN